MVNEVKPFFSKQKRKPAPKPSLTAWLEQRLRFMSENKRRPMNVVTPISMAPAMLRAKQK
jgi:hypothetical protein